MTQLLSAAIGTTWYFPFEVDFILWLQSLGGKGTFLYYLMNFITMFGEELILVGIMGTVYWGLDKKGGERIALFLLSSTLFTPMIKNIACRTRPFDTATDIQNFRDVEGYSFPSGHSSGSASTFVGTAVTYRKKRWKWLTICSIIIPLLVALSRNYLGAHYLTDVLAGLALGVLIVFVLQWLLSKVNKWYIYIGLVLIGFVGMFYCTTEDFFTGYGLICGFAGGILFEQKITKFQNTKVWWRIVMRVAFGGLVYLGLNELIKLPFNNLLFENGSVKENMIVAERIFRTVRYAVVNFCAIAIYPLLFKVFDKVWIKFGWIKADAQQRDNNTKLLDNATQQTNQEQPAEQSKEQATQKLENVENLQVDSTAQLTESEGVQSTANVDAPTQRDSTEKTKANNKIAKPKTTTASAKNRTTRKTKSTSKNTTKSKSKSINSKSKNK